MKITKVPKRLAEALPQVQDLLRRVLDAADDELPDILDGIIDWCWPRGDLHYWVPVLNRFDVILEETCRDYDLAKLQVNEFTPMRKRIVISVLHFSRLLIENSTSRKLYNSYEHLNNLLLARDVDILEAVLRLLLRFAQQQSNQQPRPELAATQQRLSSLAVAWPPRDLGISNIDLAKPDATISPALKHVRFQIYHANTSPGGGSILESAVAGPSNSTDDGLVQTPVRARPQERGVSSYAVGASGSHVPSTPAPSGALHDDTVKTLDLGKLDKSSKDAMDILADAIEKHDIPKEDHLELFQRIRLARSADNSSLRHQLLICRLLALASYAHVTSESLASVQLFLFEPDVVQNTAELVKPEHGLDQTVVSAALYALDALGRYRNKLSEVLSSLSASVNHGILMQVLRKIIEDVATGHPKQTSQTIDAFYGLVSFITSTSSGSSLVVGAGLVQLLVQLLERADPQEYVVQRTMTRTLGLLDSLVYAYPPAFDLFCQARGLDIIVRRIESQVSFDIDIASSEMQQEGETGPDAPYGKLTYGRAHLLRGLLQSILHMMVSTGTADGLRNLIDTSLVASIKTMMINRRVFGPQNLALAINLMATFVHNEPTTLGVIQEKELPEAFLTLIKDDIEAHFDVISAIPNAVGALCLNQAGLDLFSAEPIIAKLLSLLTSERHIRVLTDQDNVSVFGGAIDELIRHQPTMKQTLMDELLQVLKTIHMKGMEFKVPEPIDVSTYQLGEVSAESFAEYNRVKDSLKVSPADILTDDNDVTKRAKHPNSVVTMMDTASHFLETIFQSTSVCKDFLKTDGLDLLLHFYDLPCVSYDFAGSPAADSLVHLLQFISEMSPNTVIHAVLRQVRTSLDETRPLWSNMESADALLELVSPSKQVLEEKNLDYRKLVKLNARIQLFADITSAFYFTQSKIMLAFLQVFNAEQSSSSVGEYATLQHLAQFQRDWCWQSILFKANAPLPPSDGKSGKDEGEDSQGQPRNDTAVLPLQERQDTSAEGTAIAGKQGRDDGSCAKVRDPLTRNLVALRSLVGQIREAMSTLLADTIRLSNAKRVTDTIHKRAANSAAIQIGKALREYLVWRPHHNIALSCAYVECATREAMKIMYEDRNGRIGNVQATVLIPFGQGGGLKLLTDNFQRISEDVATFFEEDGKPKESADIDAAVHMSLTCSAMRASLKLFLQLVCSKTLLESPSTQAATTKDTSDRSTKDYFNPHESLIQIRAKILAAVQNVWKQKWLAELPVSSLRLMIQLIVRICEATGEEAPKRENEPRSTNLRAEHIPPLGNVPISANGTGLSAALAGLSGTLSALGTRSHTLPPDQNRVNQLTDMGFSRRAASHALGRNLNNVSAAAEYLLTHPAVVQSMTDDTPDDVQGDVQTTGESGTADVEGQGHRGNGEGATLPETGNDTSADQTSIEGASAAASSSDPHFNDAPANQGDIDMADGAKDNPQHLEKDEDVSIANKTHDELAKKATEELNEMRKDLTRDLVSRALMLADRHVSLIFDVKAALFVASDGFRQSELLVGLIKEIEESASASDAHSELKVSNRLHLLALTFNDTTVTVELSAERAKQMMAAIRTLMGAHAAAADDAPPPKWTASLLLVLAAVLRADYHILPVDLPGKESASSRVEEITVPSTKLFEDDFDTLLDYTIKRLQKLDDLTSDDLLAFYRFIVLLTRSAHTASAFAEKDGLVLMTKPFATLEVSKIEGCRPHAVLIMRNIIEASPALLRRTMRATVVQWFKQQRSKTIDTSSMSRGLSSVMLRDPNAFLEIANQELQMIDFSPGKGQGFIRIAPSSNNQESAKPDKSPKLPSAPISGETQSSVSMDSPSKADQDNGQEEVTRDKLAAQEESERTAASVVHFLISESQRIVREMFSPKTENSARSPAATNHGMDLDKDKIPSNQTVKDGQFLYVAFMLQTLAELLSSYGPCKTAFLQYSRKRPAAHSSQAQQLPRKGETPIKSKQGSSATQSFLAELVPFGFICERSQEDMRRAMCISNWAMSSLVALCSDVPVAETGNEESVAARKSVAEALIKSYKDATGSAAGRTIKESTEARHGRLYALSDLCYRLFTANPNRSSSSSPFDDSTIQLVKVLLERNFVTILTTAITDVDLNTPTAKVLVERILKPLEHLTKIANMMNKAERKDDRRKTQANPVTILEEDRPEILSEEDTNEDAADDETSEDLELREETPDFYRNSSLGMHTGDLEGGPVDYDDDDDEEEDDEEMEDEMRTGMGYDDEMTDDDSDSDSDIEEHIVEIMDEGDDSDTDGSGSEGTDESDDHDEEGSWIDEDDQEVEEDEDGEALDLVLEEGDGEGREIFDVGDGPIFTGDEAIYDDGLPGPILADGEAEEEEDADDMDEEDNESMLEEAFEDGLDPVGLNLAGDSGLGAPVDRFGASWGWASGNSNISRQAREGDSAASVSPFTFLRQRPASGRHQRSLRRLMDWDRDALRAGRPRHMSGGPLISGIHAEHAPQASRDVASHPLLFADSATNDRNDNDPTLRSSRPHLSRRHPDAPGHSRENWTRSIEELMSGGALQVLETLLNRGGMGDLTRNSAPQPISISIASQNGMPHLSVAGADGLMELSGRETSAPSNHQTPTTTQRDTDLVTVVQDFATQKTTTRWGEAIRILHGPLVEHRLMNLRNYVILALLPGFVSYQEEQKKSRSRIEEKRRERTEELEKAKCDKERLEKELEEVRNQYDERRSQERNRNAEQTAPPETEAAAHAQRETPANDAVVEDTIMEDGEPQHDPETTSTAPRPANLELGSLQQGLDELDTSVVLGNSLAPRVQADQEQTESHDRDSQATERADASLAPRAERITTMINGAEVDITDSGIDPTFLEALPEDMREEVLNQHFRERRAAQAASRASSAIEASNIAPEFLNALPPEIRAEVIQQEAMEQHRRRNHESRRGANDEVEESSRPLEMDSTDFLATLNPDLRSAILQDGDPSFLETLPLGLHEDIDAARRAASERRPDADRASARARRRVDAPEQAEEIGSSSVGAAQGTKNPTEEKKKGARDAIQLLDRSGVAALIRLMFLPQLDVQQSGLRNVLANISENSKTRGELVNLLLLLLAENAGGDGSATDRSITALAQRSTKAIHSPVRPSPKRSVTGTSSMSEMASVQRNGNPSIAPLSRRTGDDVPFLVALRSIDMLLHLTISNEQAAHHFLLDDSSSSTLLRWYLRNTGSTNVKGKERSVSSTSSIAPVNILLVLLGKSSILGNAQLVDGLIALLNIVTRPLLAIAANEEKAREAEGEKGQDSKADADAAPAPSAAPATSTSALAETGTDEKDKSAGLPTAIPSIADERLYAVVKPLSTSISSKGFQHTLAVASHLSVIDGARDTIMNALHKEALMASRTLLGELDTLLESLPEPPAAPQHEEDDHHDGGTEHTLAAQNDGSSSNAAARTNGSALPGASLSPSLQINSPTLTELASPSSSQTIILRSLRALEWVLTRPSKSNAPSTSTNAHMPTHAQAHNQTFQPFAVPTLLGRSRFGVQ